MQGVRWPSPSASQRGQKTTSCICSRHRWKVSSSHFARAPASEPKTSRTTPEPKGLRQSGTGQRRDWASPSETWIWTICSRHDRQAKWSHSRKSPREPTTSSKHMGQTCTSRCRRSSRTLRSCANRRRATSMAPPPSAPRTRRSGGARPSCSAAARSKSTASPGRCAARSRRVCSRSERQPVPRCSASSASAGGPAPSSG
mmetsp:Transcript_68713/g.201153  ORF Transcript_68713/g.201153 Transcript_68713/m.201153 type:complete len:200 (-) Transcript_68713:738-1337(-)